MSLRQREVSHITSFLIVIALHGAVLFFSLEKTISSRAIQIKTTSPSISISVKNKPRAPEHKIHENNFVIKKNEKNRIQSIDNEGVRDRYFQGLSTLVRNSIIYPRLSKRLKEKGEVEVEFTLNKNGAISSLKIIRMSPYDRLNQAAIETIRRIKRYLPIPQVFNKNSLKILQVIEFD